MWHSDKRFSEWAQMDVAHFISVLIHHDDPSVRWLALTQCLDCPEDDPELCAAHEAIVNSPPVRAILDAQYPVGYWMHPDLGISPRYRATVWQVLFLAQFGVGRIPPVTRAVDTVLSLNLDQRGGFRLHRNPGGRSLALTGALLWALAQLGFVGDARLSMTWEWVLSQMTQAKVDLAGMVWTGRAGAAWGVEVLSPAMVEARLPDLVDGMTSSPANFAFPLTDQPDRLAILEMLVDLGLPDTVPCGAKAWLLAQRQASGYWPLLHTPTPQWGNVGELGESNPWVTLRVLRVLRVCQ